MTEAKTAEWADAHCHLADSRLEADLESVLQRSRGAGVGVWVQGGICPEDWQKQRKLRRRLGAGVVTAFGLHPWWVCGASAAELACAGSELEDSLGEAGALGELGLDFSPRFSAYNARQTEIFERQLVLGKAASIPLVLHIVRAHPEALALLRRHGPFPQGGIVHAFTGSADTGRAYLDLGFALSVGGAVTREGFAKLKKGLPQWPGDRLLVETDCPDQVANLAGLPPGSLGEPAHLLEIASAVAALRAESREEVLARSTANVKRIFRIAI